MIQHWILCCCSFENDMILLWAFFPSMLNGTGGRFPYVPSGLILFPFQVYNITSNIQEDDLQHLQLFTEYGRLAMEDNGTKPFQVPIALSHTAQSVFAGHGMTLLCIFAASSFSGPRLVLPLPVPLRGGGRGSAPAEAFAGEWPLSLVSLLCPHLVFGCLQIVDNQHKELHQLREHIRSCFERIGCFLMPHPGLKVATNPYFDGRLAGKLPVRKPLLHGVRPWNDPLLLSSHSDIEGDFKKHLQDLIPLLLSPDNVVVKEIHGSKITGKELVEYFKVGYHV